jgi:aromatic-L-amino-acid decarboxylase
MTLVRFQFFSNSLVSHFIHILDYAWETITDFATELLEKEQDDKFVETTEDPKKKHTLAQKRSFFVRMVSDPKIYNPAINKAGTPRISMEIASPTKDGIPVTVQSPPQ